jgi:N-acetylneuraminic acid mutarotase
VAFVLGGRDTNNTLLSSVERYDVEGGAWQEVSSMALARRCFGPCELNGELYVTGGLTCEVGAEDVALATVERYDPSLDTWSVAPAMPQPRFGHCACAVGDAMYVLGGIEEIDEEEHAVSSVLKFDSRTQTWTEVAPMPAERDYAGACVVGSSIYVIGGRDNDETTSTTYRYSTETNTWATFALMPAAKVFQSVCVLDRQIYAMGGKGSDTVSSVHRFDPVTNSWSELAPLSVARSGSGAFVLGKSIHMVGGWDGAGVLTSMERYCVASDSWSVVNGVELGEARNVFRAHTMQLQMEENLFDSLIMKAKRARQ